MFLNRYDQRLKGVPLVFGASVKYLAVLHAIKRTSMLQKPLVNSHSEDVSK